MPFSLPMFVGYKRHDFSSLSDAARIIRFSNTVAVTEFGQCEAHREHLPTSDDKNEKIKKKKKSEEHSSSGSLSVWLLFFPNFVSLSMNRVRPIACSSTNKPSQKIIIS